MEMMPGNNHKTFNYFSRNGRILPMEQAVIGLDNIEYTYGFGVYETIRAKAGRALFLEEHCRRLLESAKIIGLDHKFSAARITEWTTELIEKNQVDTCNLKLLLIGGREPVLNVLCLNPRYPDRKLYKQGAHVISVEAERPWPHAKTLNMLPSYLAYRQAKTAGAYDALLVNRHGCITEGTSTNFFAMKGRTIFSPPEKDILLGVTRDHVLQVARDNRFEIVEKDLKLADVKYYDRYDSLFITSTSTKIMPLRSVDDHEWKNPSLPLKELMSVFDKFI